MKQYDFNNTRLVFEMMASHRIVVYAIPLDYKKVLSGFTYGILWKEGLYMRGDASKLFPRLRTLE